MTLAPIKLFKGDPLNELVESFSGFTDFALPTPFVPVQSKYDGALVAANNGGGAHLPRTNVYTPDDLLFRATPTLPIFNRAGTYALTLVVAGDALTPGGYVTVDVNTTTTADLARTTTAHPEEGETLTGVFKVAAREQLPVLVTNHDGVAARSFRIASAVLIRLSP